ncbi:hypothetical protein TI39_contig5841g00012 [Zymoseptoria brevis]|uniref:Uncharacterized protein n=1 Tax=Zymoseptoria brevis TaxID=1047168 RepID=A0A0F4G8J9_9PEZI|nr:hypothetical protein TI39_contig5841g00012 [Zymoseptoria brevis]
MPPRSPPPSYNAAIAAINASVSASPQFHQGINAANPSSEQHGGRQTDATTPGSGIPQLFHPIHDDDVFAPSPRRPTFTFDDTASDSSQRTTSSNILTNASPHFEHASSLQHLTAPPPPSQAFDFGFDFDNFTPNPLILEPWMSTSFENVSVMYQAGVAAQRRRRGLDGRKRGGRRAGVGERVDEGGDESGRARQGGRVRRWIGRLLN